MIRCVPLVLIALWPAVFAGSASARDGELGSASGLQVPRFVSLKSDHVNVRGGPTKDHEVSWIYTRAGLPVEVTAEFENWRRVRDSEGSEGWVYHSLLAGKRTVMISTNSLRSMKTPIRRAMSPRACSPASPPASSAAPAAGAASAAAASTAGSSRRGCGASIPARRWSSVSYAAYSCVIVREVASFSAVVPGLDPGIHISSQKMLDCLVSRCARPGNDGQ
jgi:SH3-like domain-containing protein